MWTVTVTSRPISKLQSLIAAILSSILILFAPLAVFAITFTRDVTMRGTLNVVSGYQANGTAGISGYMNGVMIASSPGYFCQGDPLKVISGGLITVGTDVGTQGCDADIAEYYGTVGTIPQRGDIVAMTASTSSFSMPVSNPAPGETTLTIFTETVSNVALATSTSRDKIIGAVPTSPGYILSPNMKNLIASSTAPQLVALAGHVAVHVTLEGGPISIGDPITVSDTVPGAGMRASTTGRILGFALAPYTALHDGEDGSDRIEVFVSPQLWVAPRDYDALISLSSMVESATANPADSAAGRIARGLFSEMSRWFADEANDIGDFFADRIYGRQLCLRDTRGTSCYTRAQLDGILEELQPD